MKIPITGLITGFAFCLTGAAAYAVPLTNANFESPTTSGQLVERISGTITQDGWTWSGPSGILNGTNNNPFQPSAHPTGFSGAQYAYLQKNDSLGSSSIAQSFTLTEASNVTISWLYSGRTAAGSPDGNTTYQVSVGSLSLTGTTTSGANFASAFLSGALDAGTYTLTLANTTAATGDHTMYLDNVALAATAVPEPRAPGIFGVGLAGLAGCQMAGQRKKRRRATRATIETV